MKKSLECFRESTLEAGCMYHLQSLLAHSLLVLAKGISCLWQKLQAFSMNTSFRSMEIISKDMCAHVLRSKDKKIHLICEVTAQRDTFGG